MIYNIICFKLIFHNKLYKKRSQNLRTGSRFCGCQIQDFEAKFGLRASSLNLRVNLIKFEGKFNYTPSSIYILWMYYVVKVLSLTAHFLYFN
jgi:hypothetical protein